MSYDFPCCGPGLCLFEDVVVYGILLVDSEVCICLNFNLQIMGMAVRDRAFLAVERYGIPSPFEMSTAFSLLTFQ